MSEQQTNHAASSAADVFESAEHLTLTEAMQLRKGEIPDRLKPADTAVTAPADQPEETASEGQDPESAGESEAPKDSQEPKGKKLNAEGRAAQLDRTIEAELEKENPDFDKIASWEKTRDRVLDRAGLKRKTDPAPVAPPQAQQPPQVAHTRPKPTVDAKDDVGNPKYGTYEDYVEDLADWKAEQRQAQWQREQAQQQQQQALQAQFEQAKTRYDNAEEVIPSTAAKLTEAQIPLQVKEAISQSDVLADLLYSVGKDEAELKKFLSLARTNPRAAMAEVFAHEKAIRDAMSGKVEAKAPEKKQTQAPKPPSPVGGPSSRGFDVSDESLSADEWMRKRNKQVSGKV